MTVNGKEYWKLYVDFQRFGCVIYGKIKKITVKVGLLFNKIFDNCLYSVIREIILGSWTFGVISAFVSPVHRPTVADLLVCRLADLS